MKRESPLFTRVEPLLGLRSGLIQTKKKKKRSSGQWPVDQIRQPILILLILKPSKLRSMIHLHERTPINEIYTAGKSILQKELNFVVLTSKSIWEFLGIQLKLKEVCIGTNIEIGIFIMSSTLNNFLIWRKKTWQLMNIPVNFKSCKTWTRGGQDALFGLLYQRIAAGHIRVYESLSYLSRGILLSPC